MSSVKPLWMTSSGPNTAFRTFKDYIAFYLLPSSYVQKEKDSLHLKIHYNHQVIYIQGFQKTCGSVGEEIMQYKK